MSLRRDIQMAFDEIAPPTGGMPERVVQTVLADRRRRRKDRMALRLRVPLALVAALMLVTVITAAVVNWNLLHKNTAPAGLAPTGALATLEARPLRLRVFTSLRDCHSGPANSEGSFGGGPIYADGGAAVRTAWGEYFYNLAYTDTVINGPVLIRVRDVYKKDVSIAFIGPFANGPVVGTDTVDGKQYKQHSELVIDESQAIAAALPGWATSHHRFVWDFLAGVPTDGSGGTGWQIDGKGFTEIFYAC